MLEDSDAQRKDILWQTSTKHRNERCVYVTTKDHNERYVYVTTEARNERYVYVTMKIATIERCVYVTTKAGFSTPQQVHDQATTVLGIIIHVHVNASA